MRNLLRLRNARIYLLGDVVSSLGDYSLWLAMAIWVKEMTGSSAWAGPVMFGYGLVGSAMGPAQTALLPAIVPGELLAEANAAQQTLVQGLKLVTPLAGAGLFVWLGASAVALTRRGDVRRRGGLPDCPPGDGARPGNPACGRQVCRG